MTSYARLFFFGRGLQFPLEVGELFVDGEEEDQPYFHKCLYRRLVTHNSGRRPTEGFVGRLLGGGRNLTVESYLPLFPEWFAEVREALEDWGGGAHEFIWPETSSGETAGGAYPIVLYATAQLCGMAYPQDDFSWEALARRDIHSVVCLTHDRPPYDPDPLQVIHAVGLESLAGDRVPAEPNVEQERIYAAGREVAHRLERGEGVVIQCGSGIGRTGTVAACALVFLGCAPEIALRDVVAVNEGLGRKWPEARWHGKAILACPTNHPE